MPRKRVIIVGAGIIGASFAFHLAQAGAHVTVLDGLPVTGGVATPHSWAWINASWGNPEPYFRLRHHSMALWRDLSKSVAGMQVQWCGGLLWDLPPAELEAYAKQQSAWGYGARLVDGAAARLIEPQIRHAPDVAVHVAEEGSVEPQHAVQKLLAAATELGAQVRCGLQVQRFITTDGRIVGVETQVGVDRADEIVVAAGTGTPHLLKEVGVIFPLDEPEGLLVHSKPAARLLNGLVMAPELHVRQTTEGRLVAGSDFGGAQPGADPSAAAHALFANVQSLIAGGADLELAFHSIGRRPTVPDGVSAIGRVNGLEGLYVCVTHSGITLAPALGALGSREILDQGRDALLHPFSPDRLLGT